MMCYDVKMELTAQLRIVNIPVYSLYNIHTTNTNSITSLIVVNLIEQKKAMESQWKSIKTHRKKHERQLPARIHCLNIFTT